MSEFLDIFANVAFMDISEMLLTFLSDKDLCNLRLTCKACQTFLDQSTKIWYKRIVMQRKKVARDNWELDMINNLLKSKRIEDYQIMASLLMQSRYCNPLRFAVENCGKNVEVLQFCWKFTLDKNPFLAGGNTPLHYATWKGKTLI